MLAQKLRYQIGIWESVKTKNTIGSSVVSEVLISEVFADVQTSMGRTATTGDKVIHTTETTFIIRIHPVMKYSYFIRYAGEKYKVVGIQELPDRTGQIIKTVRVE